jgi:hypothetical protein
VPGGRTGCRVRQSHPADQVFQFLYVAHMFIRRGGFLNPPAPQQIL